MSWAVAVAALPLVAPGLHGQARLAVEGSVPFASPVSTFGDQGTDGGAGFGVQVIARVFSPVLVYAGWDRTSFDCPACTPTGDVQVDGLAVGMEAQLNPQGRWRPWFRAGVARRHVDADAGTIGSPDVWAIQAALGVLVRVVPRLDVRVGSRFETMDPALDLETDQIELGTPVSYTAVELGVRFQVVR